VVEVEAQAYSAPAISVMRILRNMTELNWSGNSLDFGFPLPGQGVRPNDVLRISTVAMNG
jgi:hypothetical protein